VTDGDFARDLVIDVGGTNARFALAGRDADGRLTLSSVANKRVSLAPSFDSAVSEYLDEHCQGRAPARIGIGAAGPCRDGICSITNAAWRIEAGALQPLCSTGLVVLANDLRAAARVVPDLSEEQGADFLTLRGTNAIANLRPDQEAACVVLNVGTGFGVAAVHRARAGGSYHWLTLGTEGGHVTNPGRASGITDANSIEEIIAGRWLADYASRRGGDGVSFEVAEDIFAALDPGAGDEARAAVARDVVKTVSWILGRATRDAILGYGAWDGVFFIGSVFEAWLPHADWAIFDEALGVGPFAEACGAVGLHVIRRPNASLYGAALLVEDAT